MSGSIGLILSIFAVQIEKTMLQRHTLSNGIRIVHREQQGAVAHCGMVINTGSRDEMEHEQGLAHFIEHVLFKGTVKRRAYHVLSCLENVGGELNAYTTKEETCIHASFLVGDYSRALELISDITFNSVFPEKELEKEKEVVIDEINSYKDTPSEMIFDDFEAMIFPNNPMGYNILGTPDHLQSFTRNHIIGFMGKNYHTDQMVFSSVGNIPFRRVVSLCEKYFGSIPANLRTTSRASVVPAIKEIRSQLMDTYQGHVVMGTTAYDHHHPKRLSLYLLNNLLGGPGMNSRLSMALRERNGIAYNVESSYTPFDGTGIFTLYFGTDTVNIDRSLDLVRKELKKLCQVKLSSIQLHRSARQLKGQLVIGDESLENQMLSVGKSILLYDRADSVEELMRKIDAITSDDLLATANEIMNPDNLSLLIYK
jgi:predicted Zn-dependent peptidase